LAQAYTTIKLRRCEAIGQCINFHTDMSHRTMQVALTSDETYGGGALVFANAEGLHFPPRPAGSATVHDCTIVHGVTELVCGVR
jgi:predicted 2-oxoglutarate/Fe(II)-dependent dioxygenase YbiX